VEAAGAEARAAEAGGRTREKLISAQVGLTETGSPFGEPVFLIVA